MLAGPAHAREEALRLSPPTWKRSSVSCSSPLPACSARPRWALAFWRSPLVADPSRSSKPPMRSKRRRAPLRRARPVVTRSTRARRTSTRRWSSIGARCATPPRGLLLRVRAKRRERPHPKQTQPVRSAAVRLREWLAQRRRAIPPRSGERRPKTTIGAPGPQAAHPIGYAPSTSSTEAGRPQARPPRHARRLPRRTHGAHDPWRARPKALKARRGPTDRSRRDPRESFVPRAMRAEADATSSTPRDPDVPRRTLRRPEVHATPSTTAPHRALPAAVAISSSPRGLRVAVGRPHPAPVWGGLRYRRIRRGVRPPIRARLCALARRPRAASHARSPRPAWPSDPRQAQYGRRARPIARPPPTHCPRAGNRRLRAALAVRDSNRWA